MLSVNIVNDQTGTDDSANYRYEVLVNFRKIADGQVTGHNRADDWRKLLLLIICDCPTLNESAFIEAFVKLGKDRFKAIENAVESAAIHRVTLGKDSDG